MSFYDKDKLWWHEAQDRFQWREFAYEFQQRCSLILNIDNEGPDQAIVPEAELMHLQKGVFGMNSTLNICETGSFE